APGGGSGRRGARRPARRAGSRWRSLGSPSRARLAGPIGLLVRRDGRSWLGVRDLAARRAAPVLRLAVLGGFARHVSPFPSSRGQRSGPRAARGSALLQLLHGEQVVVGPLLRGFPDGAPALLCEAQGGVGELGVGAELVGG